VIFTATAKPIIGDDEFRKAIFTPHWLNIDLDLF
jgi:hypothetical protein